MRVDKCKTKIMLGECMGPTFPTSTFVFTPKPYGRRQVTAQGAI